MREILFRGKTYDGKWEQGDLRHGGYIRHDTEIYIMRADYALHNFPVVPETVGQFTGLTDKNGKKIFEGDIVKIKDFSRGCALNCEQPTSNWVVKWYEENARFGIDYMPLLPYKDFGKSEVIGNIHDNPELLKGGE